LKGPVGKGQRKTTSITYSGASLLIEKGLSMGDANDLKGKNCPHFLLYELPGRTQVINPDNAINHESRE